jgi:prepilin-type N-terminal cleavage/methylation domain-containing protein
VILLLYWLLAIGIIILKLKRGNILLITLRTKLKNQRGFTLIELLVVISIIGVLAAVAVPKFMDSTAVARTAKVQADLAAIDSAIQLYGANNNGNIPTVDQAKTLLNGSQWPTAPTGTYRIDGLVTASITPGAYEINSDGLATIKLDKAYTAATLKAN